MAHSSIDASPIPTVTASGDKLIVFTPGKGIECRIEADIIRNKFGMYSVSPIFESKEYPGWLTMQFSVDRNLEEILTTDVLLPEFEKDNREYGSARMFSHLAIAYEGGVHVVAVRSALSPSQWYFNRLAPEFADNNL